MIATPNTTVATPKSGQNLWRLAFAIAGIASFVLAAYQFVVVPLAEPLTTTNGSAAKRYWPVFAIYLLAMAGALISGRGAMEKAQKLGASTAVFSFSCGMVAVCGAVMSLVNGASGIGGNIINFYWTGLAIIWVGSILMIHFSEASNKALAVRDWTVYSCAMLLLPLTIVPSIPIWPVIFDLDIHQTMITATTSSFAAHFLIAHYIVFEILEKRR